MICSWDNSFFKIIKIYASNEANEQNVFFEQLSEELLEESIVLCGDFNSVMSSSDRISRRLDEMSSLLNKLVRTHNLCEPQGFLQFTYQHPSLPDRQSRIDYFLVSKHLASMWLGSTHYCAFSDHQAILLFPKKQHDQGVGLWLLSNDLLQNTKCQDRIRDTIWQFSQNEDHAAVENWLLLKCECKYIFQEFSKF